MRDTLARWLDTLRWALRGFSTREAFARASALAFDTALALVPTLVLASALLDAFGLLAGLRANALQPWIDRAFSRAAEHEGQVTLHEAFTALLDYVEAADLSKLGVGGALALSYAVWMLLSTMEQTFNIVFGVRQARPMARRVAEYAAFFAIVPLCLALGGLLATLPGLSTVADHAFDFLSIVAIALAIAVSYRFIPHTPVPMSAAFMGAAVAAVLGYLAFLLQVMAQLGVGRYNTLYASLAALPLFLLWLLASWLAVLFGAEVAAMRANPSYYRYRVAGHEASSASLAAVALGTLAVAADYHESKAKWPPVTSVARRLMVPRGLVEDALAPLREIGCVLPPRDLYRPRVRLAVDPREMTVDEVLFRLRGAGVEEEAPFRLSWLSERFVELRTAPCPVGGSTLADLAATLPARARRVSVEEAPT